MQSRSRLAIVIPTFDRASSLARAIASVLEQAGPDHTLVVVDDGSTDGTAELLGTFDDDRLVVVTQENRGRCAARNAGAAATDAPWLVFLDSDDELLPGALAAIGRAIEATSLDLVVGHHERTHPDGSCEVHPPSLEAEHGNLPAELAAGAFAIRRSLFEDVGGYCVALDYSEHTEMVLKMRSLTATPRVGTIGDPLVRVRKRGSLIHPRVRMPAVVHILDHASRELADDPKARSVFLRLAGVDAIKLGRAADGRRYLWQAFRARPDVRGAARLLAALVPRQLGPWRARPPD